MRLKYFFTNETTSPLDPHIDAVQDKMLTVDPTSEEYTELLAKLEKLYEIKGKDRRSPISKDTLVIVGGNLLLGGMIMLYENKHVVTSKGFSLLHRPKGPGIS